MGSMSTQNMLQQLYSMQMMQAQQPYMAGTAQGISQMGLNPTNAFQSIPNWDQYVNQSFTQPTQYGMTQQLKDLASSPELYSSAYNTKKEQLMSGTEMGLQGQIGNAMMGQRSGQITGMESALKRQLSALNQFNTIMGAPLSVQGQENTIQPRSLLGSIFGG